MIPISPQFSDYLALKQQQTEQMQFSLNTLQEQIATQVALLKQQEQTWLDAQTTALAPLRPVIEADARCLLFTPEFEQVLLNLIESRRLFLLPLGQPLIISPSPATWLLATQSLPLSILQYEEVRDDYAYNDENHYTDYRYRLTVQLGSWSKTVSASVVSLYPGHPMSAYIKDFASRFHDVAYCLLKSGFDRLEPVLQPEFPELLLNNEQQTQLQQELCCLLTFVGEVLTPYLWVDYFRYPQSLEI